MKKHTMSMYASKDDMLAAVLQENELLQADAIDAQCFRFWVSEAARSPSAMARLIAHCTTEQDYRDAIMPIVRCRQAVISAAKGKTNG